MRTVDLRSSHALPALPLVLLLVASSARAQLPGPGDLATLTPGKTKAQNALWIENDLAARFNSTNRVVVADLKGPAEITMIHFALPQSHFAKPPRLLNRDLRLRAFWDGETSPSVEVPLVDFFCDPAGLRDSLSTALVNKRRGFNAYFPMPFWRSAKIELAYDGVVQPGEELWRLMPCYSYVMYRTLKRVSADTGYFHASWRQEGLLLGQRDYLALEARGKGKFVGWNVTVRSPGRSHYPVDENEKFYIDGEPEASIEFQGLEDSFGFSWGFPETESTFPLTGYFSFFKGAAAYRFFLQDAISFDKSLRVAIGFGAREDPMFRRTFSKRGSTLQLSSTAYWYQLEPHAPLPSLPASAERAPAPEEPFWPEKEALPSIPELKNRKVQLEMLCGRPEQEVLLAEAGFGARMIKGYAWSGWSLPVYYCCAGDQEVEIELTVPAKSTGLLRVYIIDPDNFKGGRKERVLINDKDLGLFENFQEGRWIERRLSPEETSDGKLHVRALNARKTSNAVISIIEWTAGAE